MILQIPFPDLSPEIFTIELGDFAFALRWYALAYIVGIVIGWRIVRALMERPTLWPGDAAPVSAEAVDDLVTWIVAGVILGGRLGYVLFYQPGYYLAHPGEVLFLWQGGMAFHGGMLGVVVAILLFSRKERARVLSVADALAIATPPGLMLGRIANFINAELWGRPTDLPWGVIFPGVAAQDCPGVEGPCARHPSQLYEAALEGVVLFALLLVLLRFRLLKRPGMATGVFLAGYGVARMIVEHFRQADAQFISADNPLGHVLRLGEAGLSMGQILSLPMVIVGGLFILYARRWKG